MIIHGGEFLEECLAAGTESESGPAEDNCHEAHDLKFETELLELCVDVVLAVREGVVLASATHHPGLHLGQAGPPGLDASDPIDDALGSAKCGEFRIRFGSSGLTSPHPELSGGTQDRGKVWALDIVGGDVILFKGFGPWNPFVFIPVPKSTAGTPPDSLSRATSSGSRK